MRSWGQAVERVRMNSSITGLVMNSIIFCTHFVRSLWLKIRVSPRVVRIVCAHYYSALVSVSSKVFPIIHRPYYYVYSFLKKNSFNNRGVCG